jgi:hypothetical protein
VLPQVLAFDALLVAPAMLSTLAAHAMLQQRLQANSPCEMNEQQALAIYQAAY